MLFRVEPIFAISEGGFEGTPKGATILWVSTTDWDFHHLVNLVKMHKSSQVAWKWMLNAMMKRFLFWEKRENMHFS